MKKYQLLQTPKIRQVCLTEFNYSQQMKALVEPFLKALEQTGYFCRLKNQPIYYETYLLDKAKASIVISHGFTENSEKYKEMIYYFLSSGYHVFILDHRGHGRSYREVQDLSATYISDFSSYIKDFHYFVQHIVKKNSDHLPLYLYAHSMGGAIAANYIEVYPTDFAKAVLSSPMLSIELGKFHISFATFLSNFMTLLGMGQKYVLTQKRFDGNEPFSDSPATSEERYNYYYQKRLVNPLFQNSASTYSWLKESLKTTKRIVKKENVKKIQIPVLLFTSEYDTFVKQEGQEQFMNSVERGVWIFAPNSKHEIYLSDTKTITAYVNTILKFLEN